ncbi:Uncharacterized protein yyaQ [Beauveria bassiana D1-5]|uniref:Uncharacterized protein yyaQ n=1 Tax=Beauveria bassiana D1-5 TaxID=1245745 RepID=A0A0A2WJP4_BEABA|nr:Uncharacterized protein yyaQ [Beauveria bassiana D1-5]
MGAIIGFSFFSEKLTARKWLGVVLGLAGIMVITSVGDAHSSEEKIAGIIACLVATSCYGVAGFLTRRWISNKGGLDPKIVAFGSQIGATLFLLPFFAWSVATGPSINWLQGNVWLSVLGLGILCTAVAYIFYFRLIADIGPLRSLTVTFLIPPFGVLWGYLILHETISEAFIIGAVIVEPDYPWDKFKDYAVLRHRYKRKWFGVVLSISAAKLGLESDEVVDILNVKVMPGAVGSLRMQPGILPAYHMNKEHWVTVLIAQVPDELILGLIDESFGLTR